MAKTPKVKAEFQPSPVLAGALSPEDLDAIVRSQAIERAEILQAEDAIPAGKRYYKLQEIKIDQFTIKRKRVLLTPSMCREANCAFDAAELAGYHGGWTAIKEPDQKLPSGKTVGQAVIGLLETHKQNGHAAQVNHILSEDDVAAGKEWAGVSPRLGG